LEDKKRYGSSITRIGPAEAARLPEYALESSHIIWIKQIICQDHHELIVIVVCIHGAMLEGKSKYVYSEAIVLTYIIYSKGIIYANLMGVASRLNEYHNIVTRTCTVGYDN